MSDHDEDTLAKTDNKGPSFRPLLYIQRYEFARNIIINSDPPITKVADFGCAEGRFIRYLKRLPQLEEIACVDCDNNCLEWCINESRPLIWDHVFGRSTQLTINVYNGSVIDLDRRLLGCDCVTMIELIEHLTSDVLEKLPYNIFGFIRPLVAIVSTPNAEFNVLFPQLRCVTNEKKKFRHYDHKFEWSRSEFKQWCDMITEKFPEYNYELSGVGDAPSEFQHLYVGFCTQIAVFRRNLNQTFDNNSFNDSFEQFPQSYNLKDSFNYHISNYNQNLEKIPEIDWDSVLS